MRGARLVDHSLVEVWIEVSSQRLDGCDPAVAQGIEPLLWDYLDAFSQRVRLRRRRLQGALEVVQNRQELRKDVALDVVGEIAAFAVDALAIVVEFGGRAEKAVLQRVLLAAQFLERVG